MNTPIKGRRLRFLRKSRFNNNLIFGFASLLTICAFTIISYLSENIKIDSLAPQVTFKNDIIERCYTVSYSDSTSNSYLSYYSPFMYEERYQTLERSQRRYDTAIFNLRYREKLHGVLKANIVRYDSLRNMKVMVFTSPKYDELTMGYWIALSYNRGYNWQYFYTGLAECWPWYLKSKTSIPLFINDSVIQVEAAMMKMDDPVILPDLPSGSYRLEKDWFKISFNLNQIKKDSDNDELTDIVETKFMTDPQNADTDHDGLIDGKDSNPRFKSTTNELTLLMKYMLEDQSGNFFDPTKPYSYYEKKYPSESGEVYMIITNDEFIHHLPETRNTYIIITDREPNPFEHWKSTLHYNMFNRYNVKSSSDFKIVKGALFWKDNYHVTRYKNGWKIKYIGGYVI